MGYPVIQYICLNISANQSNKHPHWSELRTDEQNWVFCQLLSTLQLQNWEADTDTADVYEQILMVDEQMLMIDLQMLMIDEQILMIDVQMLMIGEQMVMSRYWWLMSRQGQSRLGEDSACFTASTLSNLFAEAAAAVGNLATLLLCCLLFCWRCCLLCCNPTTLLLALLQSSSRPSCLVWLLGANT